jgi:hypothetical protein
MTLEYLCRGALHTAEDWAVDLDGGWRQHFDLASGAFCRRRAAA